MKFWNPDLTARLQRIFETAAEKGHAGSVKWLIEHGSKVFDYGCAFDKAVRSGRIEVVQLLHTLVSSMDPIEQALEAAAENGHLNIVQWLLRDRGVRFKFTSDDVEFAVGLAAGKGNLEVVQWLHANRTSRDRRPVYSISDAVSNGQLEIVKWLVEHSDQEDDEESDDESCDLDYAAANGHLAMLIWLDENTYADCTPDAMNRAAGNNHLHIVKWLHENRSEGCTTRAMGNATSVEMVEWLHANRSEGCTTAAMDEAAKRGDFDTLLFLHENRIECCTIRAAIDAYSENHLDVFERLGENYPNSMNVDEIRGGLDDEWDKRTDFLDTVDRVQKRRRHN